MIKRSQQMEIFYDAIKFISLISVNYIKVVLA